MGKFKDLVGQEFNRLTVLKRDKNNKHNQVMWICQCNCENKPILTVESYSLTKGKTKSCGCLAKELTIQRFKKYNTYNLTNKYGIGYTSNTNEEFYFDLEDYEKIKDYCWRKNSDGYIVTNITINKKIFVYGFIELL